MKKPGKIIKIKKIKDTIPGSPGPLPREHYNRVPLQIREGYRQVVMKMRTIPAKKAAATFELAVKIWKPIVMELRADFEKQRQARELPHNMKFTDYFLQFQQAANRDSGKTPGLKKAAGRSRPHKQKKAKPRHSRPKRK
ncbi:MAG: hypothetical protein Q7J98_11915 [Kiritimatiellia bacterium]|nr:hypothetical protein [Kiritimatiellia bacterium]